MRKMKKKITVQNLNPTEHKYHTHQNFMSMFVGSSDFLSFAYKNVVILVK